MTRTLHLATLWLALSAGADGGVSALSVESGVLVLDSTGEVVRVDGGVWLSTERATAIARQLKTQPPPPPPFSAPPPSPAFTPEGVVAVILGVLNAIFTGTRLPETP